jgi:glycerol-3-phosphate dehydrogenase
MMKKNFLSLSTTMKFSHYYHHQHHSKCFSVLIDYYQKVQLPLSIIPPKITIIGSGNFGTAIARRIALNIEEQYKLSLNKTNNHNDGSSSNSSIGVVDNSNSSNDNINNKNSYEVKMWIYDEMINGKLLSSIINNDRINIKYLPNVILPPTIKVYSDLIEATYDADILIFVVSKKYLRDILKAMKGK